MEICKDVHFYSALDRDRVLFDSLIPLPQGTSYNSYLVIGSEKTALIDTADPGKQEDFNKFLKTISRLDYVVCNHAEQDHSGCIPMVLKTFPEAMVVTNEKCKSMLIDLLHIPQEKFLIKDRLSLGNKTLEFHKAPWVHWPETMFTHLIEDKILFTCDFLGSHIASEKVWFDESVILSAKRYYAEIMMPFRQAVQNNLKIIDQLQPRILAPSHGPMHNTNLILNAYKDWVADKVKSEVIVAYVSMHGSTEKMAMHLAKSLELKVKVFNLEHTDLGDLAMALVDCACIIICSPTFLVGAHPTAVNTAYLINALKPKAKFAGVITSYGWAGKAAEQLQSMMNSLKVTWLDALEIKGAPREQDYQRINELAQHINQIIV